MVAFAARLGENFDDSKLREAFITADFVEAETKRQEELQIKGGNQLSQLPSNEDLAMKGSLIINQSLCAYVRWALPYLPEEGVQAVVNFLTTVWFMLYLKCSNWHQISKLLSNCGCLFTFCYLDRAS